MLTVIVLAGEIRDDRSCRHWLAQADDIICADGGARHLQRMRVLPDLLLGDLDSIDDLALSWLRRHSVPVERHPVAKDATDAQLALERAIERKSVLAKEQGIILLGALGSRPDHVLATQLLAARLAEPRRAILLSDGVSRIYSLVGSQSIKISLGQDKSWLVSVLPISEKITGLTYSGLEYRLVDGTLLAGDTKGISNRLARSGQAEISLKQGRALVVVTPDA
jgi:thiamine pyrophosphokinase